MPRLCIIAADPLQGEEAAAQWLPRDLEVTRRSGEELSALVLFEDLGQPGMFAESRALLYLDPLAAKLNKKESQRCADLLERLPETTYLAAVQVVQEEQRTKADAMLKHAGLRLFTDGAKVEDLRQLASGPHLQRWLLERALDRHGINLTPRQAQRIIASCSASPSLAASELLKLGLLKPGAEAWAVSDDVLDELIQTSPAAQFYALVNLLLSGDPAVQPALASWFDADAETFRLIFELKRRLLHVRSLRRGESIYPAFAARAAQDLSRRLPTQKLGLAIEALARLEHGLKSAAYPAESSRLAELGALQLFCAELQSLQYRQR